MSLLGERPCFAVPMLRFRRVGLNPERIYNMIHHLFSSVAPRFAAGNLNHRSHPGLCLYIALNRGRNANHKQTTVRSPIASVVCRTLPLRPNISVRYSSHVNTDSINKTPSQLPPADDDPSSKSPVENSSTGGGTPPNIEDPRSPNGTFPPGISGNPRGRPRGSLNRYSRSQAALLARTLLEERTADITQKIIEAAMTGNILALKLCADRLFPAPQDVPIPFTIPKPGSPPNDVLEAHRRSGKGQQFSNG